MAIEMVVDWDGPKSSKIYRSVHRFIEIEANKRKRQLFIDDQICASSKYYLLALNTCSVDGFYICNEKVTNPVSFMT